MHKMWSINDMMIYLLNIIGLTPGAVVQYTFTHKQNIEQHMKQNTHNRTYITIIHKHNNKNM